MFFFCSREDDEVKGLEERQERSGLHPLCLAVDDEGDHRSCCCSFLALAAAIPRSLA
jgi:hypothetical protein